jgi:hypothetical protein
MATQIPYQLPTGKTVFLTLDQLLDEKFIQLLISNDAGIDLDYSSDINHDSDE